MIGQILQRDIGVIDEKLIVRVSGFIGEQEIAVSDIELTDTDMNRRAVVLLLNLLAGLFYPLRFCLLSRWRMNVANAHPVDGGIVDIDPGYFWRVFEEPILGHPPAPPRDFILPTLGIDRAPPPVP